MTPAFFAFVDDGLEDFDFLRASVPGTGVSAISPVNLTPIAAILRISARAISGRVVGQPNLPGRNDARAVDDALLDVIAERDVAVGRTAAGEDRRVAGFELRLHLRLLVGPGVDVPVRIDEPGHRRHALWRRSSGPPRRTARRPPPTRSFRARTTIDPRSITVPLATMMRALVIVRSCAATRAAAETARISSAARCVFMRTVYTRAAGSGHTFSRWKRKSTT